ncbi:MAG: hypothetical protein AAFR21_00905 [Pseudomonadota bacterium]
MTMATRIVIIVLVALIAALPAKAASTIFSDTVFDETNVADSGNAVGLPNGSGAVVGDGGELVLQYDWPLTGAGVAVSLLPSAGLNVLAVSIGDVIGGVATFSGEFVILDTGLGGIQTADLTSQCSAVNPAGCSLIKIRNPMTISGAGFIVDGVGAVTSAPEPAFWSMMIIAFILTGWRMKILERSRSHAKRLQPFPTPKQPAFYARFFERLFERSGDRTALAS